MCVELYILGNLFKLRKKDHLCGYQDAVFGGREKLGMFDTVTECAVSCRNHATCNHFSYAKFASLNSRICHWEKTIKPGCPIGFVYQPDYDFYVLLGNSYTL